MTRPSDTTQRPRGAYAILLDCLTLYYDKDVRIFPRLGPAAVLKGLGEDLCVPA